MVEAVEMVTAEEEAAKTGAAEEEEEEGEAAEEEDVEMVAAEVYRAKSTFQQRGGRGGGDMEECF